MPELSDADVWGTTPTPQRELTDAQVFGGPPPQAVGGQELSDQQVWGGSSFNSIPQSPDVERYTQPQPQPQQAGVAPEDRGWSVTRGLVSGFVEQNPQMFGQALEGLSHMAPEWASPWLRDTATSVLGRTKGATPPAYQLQGKEGDFRRLFENPSVADAMTWAGETLGSGLASTTPSLVGGLGGGLVGAKVGGPVGGFVGGVGGSMIGGASLNYGELYKELKEAGLQPAEAAKWASYALPAMSLLDAAGIAPSLARLLGVGNVKQVIARGLARRLSAEAGKSAAAEGITEGAQEAVKLGTVAIAAENKPFMTVENAWKILESLAGGALVGGVTGGASGLKRDVETKPPTEEEIRRAFEEMRRMMETETPMPLPSIVPLSTEPQEGVPSLMQDPAAGVQPTFYSQLQRAAERRLPENINIDSALNMIRKEPGVTEEEIQATGLGTYIVERRAEGQRRVSRQEILEFLEENQVRVEEVISGTQQYQPIQWIPQSDGTFNSLDHGFTVYPQDVGRLTGRPGRFLIAGPGLHSVFPTLEAAQQAAQDQLQRNQPQDYSGYVAPGLKTGYRALRLTLPRRDKPITVSQEALEATARRYFNLPYAQLTSTQRALVQDEAGYTERNIRSTQEGQDFIGSHWSEVNVLAHFRVTDRVDASGRPVLHVEEIQSDWHQQGREVGYRTNTTTNTRNWRAEPDPNRLEGQARNWHVFDDNNNWAGQYYTDTEGSAIRMAARQRGAAGVPDAPFKSSWVDLAFKAVMRHAASKGYSRVSWSNGRLAADYSAGGTTDPEVRAALKKFYEKTLVGVARKWARRLGGVVGQTFIKTEDVAPGPYQVVDVTADYPDLAESRYYVSQDPDANGDWGIYDTTREGWPRMQLNLGTEEAYRRHAAFLNRLPENQRQTWTIRASDGQELGFYRNEAEAQKALQTLVDTPGEKVWHLDLSEKAKGFIQEGLPLFHKPLTVGVSVKEGHTKNQTFTDEVARVLGIFMEISRQFGFKNNLHVDLYGDNVGTPTGKRYDAWGIMVPWQRSAASEWNYTIGIALNRMNTIEDFYSVLMHEFGHAVMWNNFEHLPGEQKRLIKEDHSRWLGELARSPATVRELITHRMSATLAARMMGDSRFADDLDAPINRLEQEKLEYHLSFNEWFADQVGRWATTSRQPLTVVESVYKRMADTIRRIFEMMTQRFKISFRPSLNMQNWLNSVMDVEAVPFTASQYAELDRELLRKNQRDLDREVRDVPAPPQQVITIPIRQRVNTILNAPPTPPSPPRPSTTQGSPPSTPTPPPLTPTPPSGGPPSTPVPPSVPTPTGPTAAAVVQADRINWLYKWMAGLDQLAEANPLFAPLVRYRERVALMHTEMSKVWDAAQRLGKEWTQLGAQGENLAAFIDDLTNMTYLTPAERTAGVTRLPSLPELTALRAKHKLSSAAFDTFEKIRGMFDIFLRLIEQNAMATAQRLISDPVKLAARLDAIRQQTNNYRKKPYFPFMRFGRYFVLVKDAAGKNTRLDTFERQGHRSAQSRQTSYAQTVAGRMGAKQTSPGVFENAAGEKVLLGIFPEDVDPLIGLPPLLLEAMRDQLQLTPAQMDALEQLQYEHSPAASFRHHFQHKNYTPGYSMDFKRAFARYFFHGGKYYAQTKHLWALQKDIKAAKLINGNKASLIREYMEDHLKNTVLDARGDFGAFKGAMFIWAMGYVPAAATQNMSQTPMVTFPFLADKFGDVQAGRAIVAAMTKLTSFYKRGNYAGTGQFEMDAIDYAIKSGRITETQAADLAGMAQGNGLLWGQGGNVVQRGWVNFMEKSAWMFEMAEQWNRRIAFRAALDLAQRKPNAAFVDQSVAKLNAEYQELARIHGPAKARTIIAAIAAVEETQFNYSKEFRPRFMRGKWGILFVFKKYMQSVLFMLGHNPGVLMRYLLIAMVIGGMQGIPGYEDFKGIIKAIGRWFEKDFDIDKGIRQYVLNLTNGQIPPDLILQGMARKGFGLPWFADMMGSFYTGRPGRGFDGRQAGQNVPWPILDRSRALTLGNILPFELGKTFTPTERTDRVIADQTQKASGAVFSVGFNMFKFIMDNDLAITDPKRWERAIPRILASNSRAWRTYNEGLERGRRGGTLGGVPFVDAQGRGAPAIVRYDAPGNFFGRDTEQMMEILAMAGGYQNMRQQAKWDLDFAKEESYEYFELQKKALLRQLHEATIGRIPAEIEYVKNRIRAWNGSLPAWARAEGITGDSALRSVETRERARIHREAGVPVQESRRGIAAHMNTLFPEATVDVRRVR